MEDIMEDMRDRRERREELDIFVLLEDIWRGFKKFWWILPILALTGAAILCRIAKSSYYPTYTAYASFTVNRKDSQGYAQNYYNKTTAEQLSTNFPYILTSGALSQVVQEDLGLETMPVTITAEAVEQTALFNIRVTGGDPQLCYEVLMSVVRNYPSVAEYIIGGTELTLVDESGVPGEPDYEPDYRRDAAKGGLAGMAAGCALLFLYALGRDTVRREEDLKKRISLSCLGFVPYIRQKKRRKKAEKGMLVNRSGDSQYVGEVFRGIRTKLVKEMEEKEAKTLVVTSAVKGEGKTTMAVNLALILAMKGYEVLLVDGDLRNPSVNRTLQIEGSGKGILEILQGKTDLSRAAVQYGDTTLRVLGGGSPQKDPLALLGSEDMRKLLDEAGERADYVILDTPPCGVTADAAILSRMADGALMVVRQDYVRTDKILYGIDSIADTGISLLGYILNGVKAGITGYGYGYSYGYGYRYGYRRRYGYGYGYGSRKKHAEEQEERAEEEQREEQEREHVDMKKG